MRAAALLLLLGPTLGLGVDFEREIRPLLQQRCAECHGATKQKGGLRLDARVFAFKGGQDGPAIFAGDASGSPLYRRVTSQDAEERMPPKGEALTTAQTQAVKQWLQDGAVWPESEADHAAKHDQRLEHWAWQPMKSPGAFQSLDGYVKAKLAEHGLKLTATAERRTLIRRVTFDLHGLPPTPEEVEAFVNDARPNAYEVVVDRLLASPRYGERYARHWLDIAHYADTHGFERDQRRDHAWHYRDYVISSLNADKPYDAFLREQIAGDVMAPDRPESVAATGFLAAGPWDFVGQVETKSEVLRRAARALDLDDMVTQVMTACCGLTVNCARCHDHKLDPISQQEYYALWSVFAGLKRGDRELDSQQAKARERVATTLAETRRELVRLQGTPLDLADMVSGGDGTGRGRPGAGLSLQDGRLVTEMQGYFKDLPANRFVRPAFPQPTLGFVDGVVLPNGGPHAVTISSTGLQVRDVPATSGHAWDAVRHGALAAQVGYVLNGVDYRQPGHSMLGLHANAAVTFDVEAVRRHHALGKQALHLSAVVGFGAKASAKESHADLSLYVDGRLALRHLHLNKDAVLPVTVELPLGARFLTLMATDGGDGIGSDLLFLGDAKLHVAPPEGMLSAADAGRLKELRNQEQRLSQELAALKEGPKVYAVVAGVAPPVHVLKRGDPEAPGQDMVRPAAPALLTMLKPELCPAHAPEGERRVGLARWITDTRNVLTRRVIVNRLWQWHFGQGLVNTPSDFGLGGGRPSHPELLDWLAEELLRSGWSLKRLHKLMVMSQAYQQGSTPQPKAAAMDAQNRLLWRQNPRRLDAEALRDAVLSLSGKLNLTNCGGPGFTDFIYTEGYAPVYQHITADKPELWRRSIYRYVTRSTPQRFMTTLDCPDPANLTPTRLTTTTALQSLALFNNDFMLRQAEHWASRLRQECRDDVAAQVQRAWMLAFSRRAEKAELRQAVAFVQENGLPALCRALFNTNEFVYVE